MNLESIKPVYPMVLLQPTESAKKSAAGLVMENTSNTDVAKVRGVILAVGEGSKFKKGQEVLWRRYSMDILKVITPKGEVGLYLLPEEDILATIDNKKSNANKTKEN